jgi:hypothetical protein
MDDKSGERKNDIRSNGHLDSGNTDSSTRRLLPKVADDDISRIEPDEASLKEMMKVEPSSAEMSQVEEMSLADMLAVEISPVELSPVELSPVELSPVEQPPVEQSPVELSPNKMTKGEKLPADIASGPNDEPETETLFPTSTSPVRETERTPSEDSLQQQVEQTEILRI